MVSSWMEKLAGKGRRGGSGVLVQISREVVGRRRSIAGAVSEVRHPAVLDALSDDDFKVLDQLIDERDRARIASSRPCWPASPTPPPTPRASTGKRSTPRCASTSCCRPKIPAREREKLLRDAYRAAQRAGYVQGGRKALARLGQRAVAAGDGERARVLLQQQVDLGPETDGHRGRGGLRDPAWVTSCAAMATCKVRMDAVRAGASFRRPPWVCPGRGRSQRCARSTCGGPPSIRRDAGRACSAMRSVPRVGPATWRSQSRLVANYAGTLVQLGRLEEAVVELVRAGARDCPARSATSALENHCLEALSRVERELGRIQEVAESRGGVGGYAGTARKPAGGGPGCPPARLNAALARTVRRTPAGPTSARWSLPRSIGDEHLEQRAYGGMGVAYSHMNMPVEALNHLMLALDLARASNDSAHEAQWLASIGEALWKFDQPATPVKAIQQAIMAARAADDNDLQAGMLSLLGQIHVSNREPGKARLLLHPRARSVPGAREAARRRSRPSRRSGRWRWTPNSRRRRFVSTTRRSSCAARDRPARRGGAYLRAVGPALAAPGR